MFLGGLSVGVCVKSAYEINWKYNSSRNEQMEMKICQLKKKCGQIMLKKKKFHAQICIQEIKQVDKDAVETAYKRFHALSSLGSI